MDDNIVKFSQNTHRTKNVFSLNLCLLVYFMLKIVLFLVRLDIFNLSRLEEKGLND